jgi:hypothetical protein
MAKDWVQVRLETPFMLLASLVGWLGVAGTPLDGIAKLFVWAGWDSGSRWVVPVQDWLFDPVHVQVTTLTFQTFACLGVALAAFGTRPPFFAIVGVGGLREIGATTSAWLIPVLAYVVTCVAGRVQERRLPEYGWIHAQLTTLRLGLAFLHLPLSALALFIGEKNRAGPQTVEIELTHRAQRALDERLSAFGMPSLNPPVPGRSALAAIRHARREVDRRRTVPLHVT